MKALVEKGQLYIEEVSQAFPQLGLGESSVILVALNKGKVVVLDNKKARRLVRELGLNVIGTLAILRKLYELGLLKMAKEELYIRLLNLGFISSKKAIIKYLEVLKIINKLIQSILSTSFSKTHPISYSIKHKLLIGLLRVQYNFRDTDIYSPGLQS